MGEELRYYLGVVKASMAEPTEEERASGLTECFKPKFLITAVKLPGGNIEIAINTEDIAGKIDYILDAYDEDMRLKTNPSIQMQNMMVV